MSTDVHEQFAKRFHPDDGCPECGRYTYYKPLKSTHNLFFMACEEHQWCWLCIPRWMHGHDPQRPATYWRDENYFKNKKVRDTQHAHRTLTMEEWDRAENERRLAVEMLWRPGLPSKKRKLLKQLGLAP